MVAMVKLRNVRKENRGYRYTDIHVCRIDLRPYRVNGYRLGAIHEANNKLIGLPENLISNSNENDGGAKAEKSFGQRLVPTMVFPARLKHILRVDPLRCCTEDIQAQNHNADCDCVRAHPRQKNNDYWLQCKRKQLGALEEKKALPRGENRNVDSIIHRNYTVYAQNQKHYTALIELRPGEGSCIDVSEHNR